jgi:hypothetical protein
LAASLGTSADSADQHLKSVGMDGNDLINSGSRICLISEPQKGSVVIGYVYNATLIEDDLSAY